MNAVPANESTLSGSASQMVLVAIDNNDQAWYEMVIPFVLSIRQTDYKGRLGVLGYGLSERKQEILRAEGIGCYMPVGVGELPYDRYVSAAKVIADDPSIAALALYDADIWFPGPQFDVFEQLADDGCVYVAPDAHVCTFVTEPLTGPRREQLEQQCLQEVLQRLGHALQAGLVAGCRTAWQRFGQFTRDCIARIDEDFKRIYGVDTTFLHLWGAAGAVRLLGAEQNFVTKWGLHERHDMRTGAIVLEHNGMPLRALHMTGDVRFLNRWRYFSLRYDHALKQGVRLSLSTPERGDAWQPVDLDRLHPARFRAVGLEPIAAKFDRYRGVAVSIADAMPGFTGLSLSTWSAHEIEFEFACDETCGEAVFQLTVSHLFDQPSCVHAELVLDGVVVPLRVPQNLGGPLRRGGRVTLRALALPGQKCHVQWNIGVRQHNGAPVPVRQRLDGNANTGARHGIDGQIAGASRHSQ